MKDRVLIYHDANKESEFFDEVDTVARRANFLCETFNTFQPWKTITTLEEFEELVTNPVAVFDKVLSASVSLSVAGNRSFVPQQLALMLGIDRENYLNIIQGRTVTSECTSCKKVRYKQGRGVISYAEYRSHKGYLVFQDGTFSVNDEALFASQDKFRVYAETPGQLEILKHWEDLVKILNDHDKMYGINATDKVIISKGLHLHLSRGTEGSYMQNKEYVKNDILRQLYKDR